MAVGDLYTIDGKTYVRFGLDDLHDSIKGAYVRLLDLQQEISRLDESQGDIDDLTAHAECALGDVWLIGEAAGVDLESE